MVSSPKFVEVGELYWNQVGMNWKYEEKCMEMIHRETCIHKREVLECKCQLCVGEFCNKVYKKYWQG